MEPRPRRAASRVPAAATLLISAALLAACSSPAPASVSPSSSAAASGAVPTATPGATTSRAPVTPVPPTPTPPPASSFSATTSSVHLPNPLSHEVAFASGTQILVAGGASTAGISSAVLAFDPAAGTVTSVGKLKHSVQGAAAGVLGDQMLVIGGSASVAGVWIQAVAADGSVTSAGTLPKARSDVSAATVGDQLIIVGGGAGATADTQVLGTTDGVHFSAVATLLQAVRAAAVVAVGNNVYVIGGEIGTGETASVQIIDVANGTVSLGKPLAGPISRATALLLGGAIVVLGGRHNHKPSSLIQRIDLASGNVSTVGQLPYKVSDAAGAVINGTGYLIGGEAKSPVGTIIVVTPGS